MNARLRAALLLFLFSTLATAQAQTGSFDSFWRSFRSAVAAGDRKAVAALAHYPLPMPYGMRRVKTAREFVRRYGEIIDTSFGVARCIAAMTPQPDPERRGEYTLLCGEAMEYRFRRVKGRFRLVGVDNINE